MHKFILHINNILEFSYGLQMEIGESIFIQVSTSAADNKIQELAKKSQLLPITQFKNCKTLNKTFELSVLPINYYTDVHGLCLVSWLLLRSLTIVECQSQIPHIKPPCFQVCRQIWHFVVNLSVWIVHFQVIWGPGKMRLKLMNWGRPPPPRTDIVRFFTVFLIWWLPLPIDLKPSPTCGSEWVSRLGCTNFHVSCLSSWLRWTYVSDKELCGELAATCSNHNSISATLFLQQSSPVSTFLNPC